MPTEIAPSRQRQPIIQFTVFADNKVGRLQEILLLLAAKDLHIIAITQLDSTDFAAVRVIVNYPELAREVFGEAGFHYFETPVIAAEIHNEADLKFVTAALVEAEINIYYLYPFISRPNGKCAVAINLEDPDLAVSILEAHGIRSLDNSDIAR